MLYSALPPEDCTVNVSTRNHGRTFFLLFVSVVLVVLGVSLFLYTVGGSVAVHLVSPKKEVELFSSFQNRLSENAKKPKAPEALSLERQTQIEQEMQRIANQMAARIHVPEGMVFRLHFVDKKNANAYAGPGGNIVIYRGLLKELKSENELAQIIGHEMAHVFYRDPLKSFVGALISRLVLSGLLGAGTPDSSSVGIGLGAATLGEMAFSREMERRADRLGLYLVYLVYGHVEGALDVYPLLLDVERKAGLGSMPEFLLDHPTIEHRMAEIQALLKQENWSAKGKVKPLAAILR